MYGKNKEKELLLNNKVSHDDKLTKNRIRLKILLNIIAFLGVILIVVLIGNWLSTYLFTELYTDYKVDTADELKIKDNNSDIEKKVDNYKEYIVDALTSIVELILIAAFSSRMTQDGPEDNGAPIDDAVVETSVLAETPQSGGGSGPETQSGPGVVVESAEGPAAQTSETPAAVQSAGPDTQSGAGAVIEGENNQENYEYWEDPSLRRDGDSEDEEEMIFDLAKEHATTTANTQEEAEQRLWNLEQNTTHRDIAEGNNPFPPSPSSSDEEPDANEQYEMARDAYLEEELEKFKKERALNRLATEAAAQLGHPEISISILDNDRLISELEQNGVSSTAEVAREVRQAVRGIIVPDVAKAGEEGATAAKEAAQGTVIESPTGAEEAATGKEGAGREEGEQGSTSEAPAAARAPRAGEGGATAAIGAEGAGRGPTGGEVAAAAGEGAIEGGSKEETSFSKNEENNSENEESSNEKGKKTERESTSTIDNNEPAPKRKKF